MKKLLPILLVLTLANCSLLKKEPSFLFVQSGKTATFDGKVLKINDIQKRITYFSDRPDRISGTMSNADFAKTWSSKKQKDSFKKDPPNSAVSYIDEKGNLGAAIVENSDLRMSKNSASYDVKILHGKLSKNMKDVTLFIDNVCIPDCRSIATLGYCTQRCFR